MGLGFRASRIRARAVPVVTASASVEALAQTAAAPTPTRATKSAVDVALRSTTAFPSLATCVGAGAMRRVLGLRRRACQRSGGAGCVRLAVILTFLRSPTQRQRITADAARASRLGAPAPSTPCPPPPAAPTTPATPRPRSNSWRMSACNMCSSRTTSSRTPTRSGNCARTRRRGGACR
ncbi:hypothetical protein C8F04DRAFT_1156995, partial [Mycena alexandri]